MERNITKQLCVCVAVEELLTSGVTRGLTQGVAKLTWKGPTGHRWEAH